MSRSRAKIDMGNPISMEDALSIMIVTFVLFVLFFIPLVNIDRAKLERAQRDTYWSSLSEWIKSHPADQAQAQPYVHAFSLDGHTIAVAGSGAKKYIEAVSPGGDITVIAHEDERYVSLTAKEHSVVVTYRYGEIRWSAAEREYFTANNTIDYGDKDFTVAMQKEFREWTRQTRGF